MFGSISGTDTLLQFTMITSSDAARMVYEAVSNLLWYHSNRLAGLRSRVSGRSIIAMLT